MYLGDPDQTLQADIDAAPELLRNGAVNEQDVVMSVRPKWLPDPVTERTPNSLVIHVPVHVIFNNDKSLRIIEGNAPYRISTNNRITKTLLRRHKPVICKPNPIKTAQRYKQIYDHPDTTSMGQIANDFGVTRVRIHQILSLLKLDKRIIDYLLKMEDPRESNFWTERKLRRLLTLSGKNQYNEFKSLSSKLNE